jgi:NADP-reducing hydrogenase subunit HndB
MRSPNLLFFHDISNMMFQTSCGILVSTLLLIQVRGKSEMVSLERFQKIKENALQQRKMKVEVARTHIVVAMGTCGIAAGARDTMAAIVDEIKKQGVSDVMVTQTGCIGLCAYEPIVHVQVGNKNPVTYGKINPERVPTLIRKHVLEEEVVTEWLVK